MNHRHLLPNEIDLLVDGEAGFGVALLRAHLDECTECLAAYHDERTVVDAMETLPHFVPDARLADRVMSLVPVFVPAHVAARDSVARWLPRPGPARIIVGVVFTAVAGALTLGMIWLATQGEAVAFITGLLGERLRNAVVSAAQDFAIAVFGETALAAIQSSGVMGASLLVGGFVLTALGTVAGIRRLAVAGRR